MVADLINTDRIVIETTHGARISPYFFIGAGLNYNYFYTKQVYRDAEGIQNKGAGIVALFANGKGYYPISQKLSVYLSLDLGAAIAAHGYVKGKEFYTAIGPGVNLGNKQTKFCDLGIRFQHMGEGANAILFRIGVGF